MTSRVTVAAANAFLEQAFPGVSNRAQVTAMEDGRAAVRLEVSPENLRPGDYISGPTQMTLADTVTYVAIFTRLGIVPMTVTTSLNISFLRPCIGKAVTAEARLIKLGRQLAVAEVEIRAEGSSALASHAVVTYAIPPAESPTPTQR
ncbi:MAG: PaaI family thioesterase [Halieaceae bacterium]|jgi:uncharacterized protein (TIGR00369 family)|nr:PaaI family thioesterase [Halieaceae bacterium]